MPSARFAVRFLLCAALLVPTFHIAAQVESAKPPIVLDAQQEARYRALLPELRCLVCQNESLADSQASLAADLRYEIRGLYAKGASDEDVKKFLTDRYGEFVLYRPSLSARTALLWAGPFLLALAGLAMVLALVRRARRSAAPPPVPDAEALRKILDEAK
ncbi:MAG: cytochrome c-type biogenesis protein CcmH [Nevskia sp.]|nr:cytochrome c-type biogenesis protein CcmH [Nevskia sp.]